jgi:hypothetical protein
MLLVRGCERAVGELGGTEARRDFTAEGSLRPT